MKALRCERHCILKKHPLYGIVDEYCFKSKNLYNYANYIIRQDFIKNGKYIEYHDLTKQLKQDDPFKDIGSNSGQHTLKLLHQNWKSFFAAIKDWNKNPKKYLGKPNIPKYLPKDGRYVWVLTNIQSKVIENNLVFSFKPLKKFNGIIKTKVNEKHMQTRFIPKKNYYVLEIVYEIEIPECFTSKDKRRIIGVDLGINNFATVQNNFGEKPFVINGKMLKSINNYYNKKLGKLRSVTKTTNNLNWSLGMQKLTDKRLNKVDNFMHHASKYLVNYCKAFSVDVVVIGYNIKWKQGSAVKKNQEFVSIPFKTFVDKLTYKLRDAGIKIQLTEESYTSKASFIDNDALNKSEFSGQRVERGLYKTKEGLLINSDINGASNIIRKVFPNAFADGIEGVDLHPVIINVI